MRENVKVLVGGSLSSIQLPWKLIVLPCHSISVLMSLPPPPPSPTPITNTSMRAQSSVIIIIIIIIIYPLTARVVRVPQVIFETTFLHFYLFSTALWNLPNSRPVHSLMLSSYLFLCLPCLLPPFTVPWKMVFDKPNERETWPYHCSLRLFTLVRRSSCGPVACWILARISSLVTWSL